MTFGQIRPTPPEDDVTERYLVPGQSSVKRKLRVSWGNPPQALKTRMSGTRYSTNRATYREDHSRSPPLIPDTIVSSAVKGRWTREWPWRPIDTREEYPTDSRTWFLSFVSWLSTFNWQQPIKTRKMMIKQEMSGLKLWFVMLMI